VCIVAVGAAPDIPVDQLATFAATILKAAVGTLEPIALTATAGGEAVIDPQRLQVGTSALLHLVSETYPELWRDREVTLLMVTGNDLWNEAHPGDAYALGAVTVRNGNGGFGIISSARMDPVAYGEAADTAVLERRMHVMLGKYLALLRYGATPSQEPASPVYGNVRSPTDLDGMAVFAPPQ
jgi:hypothetical protein